MAEIPGFDAVWLKYHCFAEIPRFLLKYHCFAEIPGFAVLDTTVPGFAVLDTTVPGFAVLEASVVFCCLRGLGGVWLRGVIGGFG